MAITPDVFWRMSWGEFVLAAEGYYQNTMQKLDLHRRLVLMIRNVNCSEKDRLTPEDFWPLPIDPDYENKINAVEPLTTTEYEERVRKAQERLKNRPFVQKYLNQENK